MKKLLMLFAAAVSLLTFNSCQDHDTEDIITPDVPVESGADYLVMFYAVGGGNLDNEIVSNIVQAIDEGGSDKVAMTFQYKLSKPLQSKPTTQNFNGTRRFTLEENAHLQGQFLSKSDTYPVLNDSAFNYYLNNINSEKIGGSDYDMSNGESLAEFINWSKKTYPNAKRTILVISDHGNGWRLVDGKAQLESQNKTRCILVDDNIGNKSLKAVDVVEGITKGGGVDLYYADACLMAMYENIYTYAKAVRYLLAAVEVTPGDGGDYRKLLNLLKSAGTTDAELEGAMHKYADHCVSEQWWGKKYDNGYIKYSDIGFYDLSKLGTVTPVLQNIANTMTEKFTSTESIEPTAAELSLSDKFAPYIRKSVIQCLVSYVADYFNVTSMPKALLPYMEKDLTRYRDQKGNLLFEASKVIEWVKCAPTDNAKAAYEDCPEDWNKLRKFVVQQTYVTYSLTDLLRQINLELSAVGAQNNPFGKLHDDLISAIKSMAYVACTEPVKLPLEQAYEYCSPGILILPLNEMYNYDNPEFPSFPVLEDAVNYYQASDFDKTIGWSSFLKELDVVPSILHNPGRNNLIAF